MLYLFNMLGGVKINPEYLAIKSWNLDQWNLKANASLQWRKLHFYFLVLSAILHTLGTTIIIPPIFNILNGHKIPVWPIYIWLFTASTLLFLGGSLMEFYLEVKHSRSTLMKLFMAFCTGSAFLYVFGALRLGDIVDHSFSGNHLCVIACCALAVGRLFRILIMTKMQWINGLILSGSSELKYQARLFLVGICEGGASGLFIAFSFWYYYFQYAAGMMAVASFFRMFTALSFYREYVVIQKDQGMQKLRSEQICSSNIYDDLSVK